MSLFRRISNLFSRSRVDREIDAELRSHIEMRVEDNVAAGMTPGEARRDALLRFGNLTKTRERVNAVDAVLAVESISMDACYAFRQLARSPGFAVATILTISLGVGASTAIFGVVNSVLIRRLSYPHAERIVQTEKVTTTGLSYTASIPLFLYWRDHSRTLQHLAAYSVLPVGFNLAERAMPERIPGLRVSADFSACSGSRLNWGATSPRRTMNLGRSASPFLEKVSGIADTTMTARLSASRFGSMESRTRSLEFCRGDFSFLAPCRRQAQLKSGSRFNCQPQAAIHAVYSNASGG
jgi:hypothetical protein